VRYILCSYVMQHWNVCELVGVEWAKSAPAKYACLV
jgi:hypothetical protein